MAFRAHELRARFTADTTDWKRAGRDIRTQMRGITSFLQTAGIAGGAGFGYLAFDALKAASAAEEVNSKFRTVFKGLEDGGERMARSLSDSFGLARSTAEQMLSDTGDLLSGFGFTTEKAAELTEQVNKLAIDLASFTNYAGGAAGASQALTKAMLGESESAKALGIVIRFGDPDFKRRVDRLMELKNMTLLQAGAEVVLQEAMAQSKNAIGDYARTSDSTANSMKRMGESWKELKETLGGAIIDVGAPQAIDSLAESIRNLASAIKDIKQNKGSGGVYDLLFGPEVRQPKNAEKQPSIAEVYGEQWFANDKNRSWRDFLFGPDLTKMQTEKFIEDIDAAGKDAELKARQLYRETVGRKQEQMAFDARIAKEAADQRRNEADNRIAAEAELNEKLHKEYLERVDMAIKAYNDEQKYLQKRKNALRDDLSNLQQYWNDRAQQAARSIAALTSVSEYSGSYVALAGSKRLRKQRRRRVENEEEFIDDLSRLLRGDKNVKFNAFGKRRLQQLDLLRGGQQFANWQAGKAEQALQTQVDPKQMDMLINALNQVRDRLPKE